jgi:hypothetical protein
MDPDQVCPVDVTTVHEEIPLELNAMDEPRLVDINQSLTIGLLLSRTSVSVN